MIDRAAEPIALVNTQKQGDHSKGGLKNNSKTRKLRVWSRLGQQLVPAGAGMLTSVNKVR